MLQRRSFIGIAASSILAPAFAHVPAQGTTSPAELDSALSRLSDQAGLAGASVTVAKSGDVLGFWSWGMASLPFSVPVSRDTLFHAGSVGKHFTAAAVLQLVETGLVDLAAPVGRYLSDIPGSWSDRPLRSLLTHTSGIPELNDAAFPGWDRPQTREQILSAMASEDPFFGAGETWHYSNTNFLLLGWVIEAVTGRSYGEYLQDRVLSQARLPTGRLDAAGDIIRNRAEPYFPLDGRLEHATRMDSGVSADPSGGVLLSAHDLAPWTQALFGGRLISKASLQEMTAATRLTSGRTVPYGCGIGVHQTRGAPFYRHSGGGPGFACTYKVLPAREVSVLVMTNSTGHAHKVIQSIAVTALEHFAPRSTFAQLARSGERRF
jgi:D-alanyl-D-alanine carboxypeptidase